VVIKNGYNLLITMPQSLLVLLGQKVSRWLLFVFKHDYGIHDSLSFHPCRSLNVKQGQMTPTSVASAKWNASYDTNPVFFSFRFVLG